MKKYSIIYTTHDSVINNRRLRHINYKHTSIPLEVARQRNTKRS